MSVRNRLLFALILHFIICVTGWSQGNDLDQLKSEQEKLNAKIEYTNKLLSKNKDKKGAAIHDLTLINKQIESRRSLVKSIGNELRNVRSQQEAGEKEVRKLRGQKEDLNDSYAAILRASYKSKLLKNRWLFLFTAHSFEQLYQRWRYLKQLNGGVQKQLSQISQTVSQIDQEILRLKVIETEKTALLAAQKSQQHLLDQEIGKQKKVLAVLSSEEKKLTADLRAQRKNQEKLRKAIVKAIETASGSGKNLPLTPAMVKLSEGFKSNRGKLPWPVEKGLVARTFGEQSHPSLRNVKIANNGVDIVTDQAAAVRAIFDGKVVGTQFIPGYDHMLIVSHGSFYTVYSYLSMISVAKGDVIKIGDTIGVARDKNGAGELHLEIWQGRELLNPESWLRNH